MAEGSYEAACMRAELLGQEKPNESDYIRNLSKIVMNENLEAAQFEEVSLQSDDLNKASGGLTELNTTLSGTQKKLNRLKGMYGSLTDLIKNKLGGSKDNMSYSTDPSYITKSPSKASSSNATDSINQDLETIQQKNAAGRDINRQMTLQMDKLDSLLINADNAQSSLNHQNKQMKSYLKK